MTERHRSHHGRCQAGWGSNSRDRPTTSASDPIWPASAKAWPMDMPLSMLVGAEKLSGDRIQGYMARFFLDECP